MDGIICGAEWSMWDRVETISRDEMAALQAARLRNCVAHAGLNVAMYRERLAAAGVGPGDVRSVDDLAGLPFTVPLARDRIACTIASV